MNKYRIVVNKEYKVQQHMIFFYWLSYPSIYSSIKEAEKGIIGLKEIDEQYERERKIKWKIINKDIF